jgi:hypothetical protein
MPPKAKPATAAKTIQKRSGRPAAAAAVKAATATLLPLQRGGGSPSLHPQPPVRPLSPPAIELNTGTDDERIAALELHSQAVIDSLDEVKERYEELMTMFAALRIDIQGNIRPQPVTQTATISNGLGSMQVLSLTWCHVHLMLHILSSSYHPNSDPKAKSILVWLRGCILMQQLEELPLSMRAQLPTRKRSRTILPS